MDLGQLVTIGGAATVVVILLEAEKRLLKMSVAAVDRFGYALALLNGVIVTIPSALYIGSDPVAAGLAGLLAGASAVGLYQAAAKSPLPTFHGAR